MVMNANDVRSVAIRAVTEHGAKVVNPYRVAWDLAGPCQAPVPVELYGKPDDRDNGRKGFARSVMGVAKQSPSPMQLNIEARCRKCEACLRMRSHMWRLRAMSEMRAAPRTWFGTLTLSSQCQFNVTSQCRSWLDRQGVDFDALSDREQFAERVKVISSEITLFLKRVRKNSGAKLRYMVVAESHKSGLPHFHLLIHEIEGICTHRVLKDGWRWGFSDFKLTPQGDLRAASYCAKYLAKQALARVRASEGYGERCWEEHEPFSLENSRRERSDAPRRDERPPTSDFNERGGTVL